MKTKKKAWKRPADMAKRRATQAAAMRQKIQLSQDIGELPPCANPERREACKNDYALFCKTYLPRIFYLPWSKDHVRTNAKIERVVKDHDCMAVAAPRGDGKTRRCQAAILWATLYAWHRYCILIGAVAPDGSAAIEWFKRQLSENELIVGDFPEICYPLKLLENEPRRCLGQRYKGLKTNIRWGKDRIVLPTMPGSAASGSAIDATSLEGTIRGRWISMPGGEVVRPTLAMVDDPQTSETSRSQGPNGQTTYRLKIINQDVQGLAGPGEQTAILVPCTVIEPGDLADQILNRKLYPSYRGERTKRIYSWPTNKALWEEYRDIFEHNEQNDLPRDEANEFYRQRMCVNGRKLDDPTPCPPCSHKDKCMDCGGVVDWIHRLDDKRNLSALQAAMHAFFKYGKKGFAAEFQNEPEADSPEGIRLTPELCQMRYNGRRRQEVPLECTEVTMGVDVQQSCVFYVVAAWKPNFTGYVIDYGVWPRQSLRAFTLADIANGNSNFQTRYKGHGKEGAIQAGLDEFMHTAIATDYARAGGGLTKISLALVDSGKWPGVIAAVKQRIGAVMMLSKGVGIRAGKKPMSTLKRKPGERHDPRGHWYMPNIKGTREFAHVQVDTNYWKYEAHSGLLVPPGDPGAITLFGDKPGDHELFAAHMTAETYVTTHGHGRDVHEFTIKPNRPDNHFLDAFVLAQLAASIRGIAKPNQESAPHSGIVRRKRVSIEEMMARRQNIEAA